MADCGPVVHNYASKWLTVARWYIILCRYDCPRPAGTHSVLEWLRLPHLQPNGVTVINSTWEPGSGAGGRPLSSAALQTRPLVNEPEHALGAYRSRQPARRPQADTAPVWHTHKCSHKDTEAQHSPVRATQLHSGAALQTGPCHSLGPIVRSVPQFEPHSPVGTTIWAPQSGPCHSLSPTVRPVPQFGPHSQVRVTVSVSVGQVRWLEKRADRLVTRSRSFSVADLL